MAEDLNGKAKHVKGKIKEGVGDLLGDREMKRDGKLDQYEGRAEQDVARAKDQLEEAVEREADVRAARRRRPS